MYKIINAREFFSSIAITNIKRLGDRRVLVNNQYYIKIGSNGMIRVEE